MKNLLIFPLFCIFIFMASCSVQKPIQGIEKNQYRDTIAVRYVHPIGDSLVTLGKIPTNYTAVPVLKDVNELVSLFKKDTTKFMLKGSSGEKEELFTYTGYGAADNVDRYGDLWGDSTQYVFRISLQNRAEQEQMFLMFRFYLSTQEIDIADAMFYLTPIHSEGEQKKLANVYGRVIGAHFEPGNLGFNPLAGKTSQAIDSTPTVPDWLRNPESKTGSNIPPRWVIHEMFEQNAQPEVQETTLRLGKVRAGAVGIAVELEKDTELMAEVGYEELMPKTMFKMVRNGAAEKVAIHAPRLQKMIDESVKEHPELKPAKPIIEHAIKASRLETDFRNAPVQSAIAKTLTDGITITIDGENFTIKEVPLLMANGVSHEMAWASGTVFNELSDSQKQKPAMALHTLENYLALSGYQSDWDRHGGQAIIDGNTIYLLDRGGMGLQLPSREDKALFGQTLAAAFNDHIINSTPFDIAFGNAVDATADAEGNINYYLATMARGQHNLGDLRRELDAEQQMQSLMAVFQSGQIDPDIMMGAYQALEPQTMQWLQNQAQQHEGQIDAKSIRIDDPNIANREMLQALETLNTIPLGEIPPKPASNQSGWRSNTRNGKPGNTTREDLLTDKTLPVTVLRAFGKKQTSAWATRA